MEIEINIPKEVYDKVIQTIEIYNESIDWRQDEVPDPEMAFDILAEKTGIRIMRKEIHEK